MAQGSGTCATGWEGAQCALCMDDLACVNGANGGTGNLAATCSRALPFAPNSVRKAFSCELPPGNFLSELIQPGTLLVRCDTGLQPGQELPAGGSAAAPAPEAAADTPAGESGLTPEGAVQDIISAIPGGSGSGRRLHSEGSGGGYRQLLQTSERYCNISFTVANPAVVDVACKATGCTINPGAAKVECLGTVCTCPGATNCNNGARWLVAGGGQGALGSLRGCGALALLLCYDGVASLVTAAYAPDTALTAAYAPDTALLAPPASPADIVNGLVSGVNGKASLDCDLSGSCSIKLTGLPIAQLDATCQAGECLVPTDQTLNVTDGARLGADLIVVGRGS